MATTTRRGRRRAGDQAPLKLDSAPNGHLTISELETWLWDAACAVRGAADAPKFKDFILPLVFYKRLSDVFDDEFAR
jgi:type I restriction enzyme M protein